MADRYQDRPFSAQDRGDGGGGDDPLAELARLIGQTDPRGGMGRANQPVKPRPNAPAGPPPRESFAPPPSIGEGQQPGPLWMQRAPRPEAPPPLDYPGAAPLPPQRQAGPQPGPGPAAFPPVAEDEDVDPEPAPSRYDDALFGRLGSANQDSLVDPAYPDDGYAYQDGEDDDAEYPAPKRTGVVIGGVVLALIVVGIGGAFAYRTFIGSSRSGEPPIIRADTGPTKIVPSSAEALNKVPDRLLVGDGTERIVPREEAPIDIDSQAGPRVVLPGLAATGNPSPQPASTATASAAPAAPSNGTLPNGEPRRIKTFLIRGGDPSPDAAPAAPAVAKPGASTRTAATAARNPAANANASAPLSLAPQPSEAAAAEPRTRVASVAPTQAAVSPSAAPPSAVSPAATGGSGYVVQVSSQRNEADAQASFRALQAKFPAVLGSRAPMIKRADVADKGVYYRALVGPFASRDEATQFCGSLETAGGQCFVQRN
jgi:hypothetical protein